MLINSFFQDAREAQERLEKLEAKIKYAFDNNKGEALVQPGGNKTSGAEDKAGLYNEIAQIQKEKLHKQKLMFELQKVEQEIHKKMVENVHRSILPPGAQVAQGGPVSMVAQPGVDPAALPDPFPVESLNNAALSLDYGNGTQNYPIPHPWNSLDLKREDLLNLSGQNVQQGVNAWEKVDQPAAYEEGPCTDLEVRTHSLPRGRISGVILDCKFNFAGILCAFSVIWTTWSIRKGFLQIYRFWSSWLSIYRPLDE